MTEYVELAQAARDTNRALDAYVMERVAGGDRVAQLRGELNAAFYRQYDIDRQHTLGREPENPADKWHLVAQASIHSVPTKEES